MCVDILAALQITKISSATPAGPLAEMPNNTTSLPAGESKAKDDRTKAFFSEDEDGCLLLPVDESSQSKLKPKHDFGEFQFRQPAKKKVG